ncbi:MAG: hypothetical protein WCC66_08495 [Rhizobiaceae bacterium]
MDWALAIDRNRDALKRIVAALFVLAGLAERGALLTLPRSVYNAVLLVLRPAESAVRRLVIIAARGLVLASRPARPAPVGLSPRAGEARVPAFVLIDPLKSFVPAFEDEEETEACGPPPRISVPGLFDPIFVVSSAQSPDDLIDASLIGRRLFALQRALDNLPREARRLARWKARRDLALQASTQRRASPFKPLRLSPFRPGWPPGYRKRQLHPVDEVLLDCHSLALHADAPNTS